MATVLVTGAGGAAGIGAIRSLHDHTVHDVIGVDMNPQAAGRFLADAGAVVPRATDPDWADAIDAVVADHDVDAVVPTVDEELLELDRLRETVPASVPVIAPRSGLAELALDKYRTMDRLERAGHTVPNTWLATNRTDIASNAFPLLVKPRRGRGSRGIARVDSHADLTVHLANTDYDTDALLLQEFIEGTEFTTSVVATRENRLLGVVPKEAIEKQGSTVTGVTRTAPAVSEDCRGIFETLAPHGPLNVQQIVDEQGRPHTIEINPRFSSTSCLTAAAGIDEFDLLVRDALGESVTAPESFEADLYIRRYEDHVFVPAAEFEGESSRRRAELID